MGLGDIAERAGGAEIAHGRTGSVGEHVIGHSHKSVFLHKHLTVFHHNGKTVHVGVNYKTYIGHALFHEAGNLSEVFGDRFGCVGEFSGSLAVELYHIFYTESTQ